MKIVFLVCVTLLAITSTGQNVNRKPLLAETIGRLPFLEYGYKEDEKKILIQNFRRRWQQKFTWASLTG